MITITIEQFWSRVNKKASIPSHRPELGRCWEWLGYRQPEPKNYGRQGWKGRVWMAHRLAWFFMFGEIPAGMRVLHLCDNPPCCNPDHLFLGTDQDNVTDCMQKGRRRTDGNARKLTLKDAEEIRKDYASGVSSTVLATKYAVHPDSIRNIVANKTYLEDYSK